MGWGVKPAARSFFLRVRCRLYKKLLNRSFRMRIAPALKEQLEAVAKEEGVSLASWLKELARRELIEKGIELKG